MTYLGRHEDAAELRRSFPYAYSNILAVPSTGTRPRLGRPPKINRQDVVDAWLVAYRDVAERVAPGWLERYPEHAARHAARADRAGDAIARAFVRLIWPARDAEAAE